MTTDEIKKELKARFISKRDAGEPATIGLIEVMELLEGLTVDTREAVALVVDDLTESNAHTIAALLSAHYWNDYEESKYLAAYKAAQWELFGTR